VEVAKAVGGSFKLVTLTPKYCNGDDSTAQGNIKGWGHKQIKETLNEYTKYKSRLNIQKKHWAQPGCINWSW